MNVSLQKLIDDLRGLALPPGWIGNWAPDGVLFHNGIAVQEMLGTEERGGYNHALKRIGTGHQRADKYFENAYRLSGATLAQMRDEYETFYREHYSEMVLDDYGRRPDGEPIKRVYSRGNSVCLQSLVVAPERDESGTWGPYRYQQIAAVHGEHFKAEWGQAALYANVGLQNNVIFFDTDLEYKLEGHRFQRAFAGAGTEPSLQQNLQLATFLSVVPPDVRYPEIPVYLRPLTASVSLQAQRLYLQHRRDPQPTPLFMHPFLDVTRSDVVALGLEGVRQIASAYAAPQPGRSPIHLLIGGEALIAAWPYQYPLPPGAAIANPDLMFPIMECPRPLRVEHLARCRPVSPYSDELDHAFREYLRVIAMKVPDPRELGRRWGQSYESWRAVSARVAMKGWSTPGTARPRAVEDYIDLLHHLCDELLVIQYTEAKRVAPTGSMAELSFTFHGMEHAWLHSDSPASGRWYYNESEYYERRHPHKQVRRGRELYHLANVARMSGKPAGFPITSPPTDDDLRHASPTQCRSPAILPADVPALWNPRCVSKDHFFMYFRDVLSAGMSHIGYYKIYNFGFYGTVPKTGTLDVFLSTLELFKDHIQPRYLRFMTPFQRVAVHLDNHQIDGFSVHGRLAGWVIDELDESHTSYGIFSDNRQHAYDPPDHELSRVFSRLFSRGLLRDSLILSPFHKELDGRLLQQYADLVTTGGGAVLAFTDAVRAAQLDLQQLRTLVPGLRIGQWASYANVQVVILPGDDPAALSQAQFDRLRALLETEIATLQHAGAPAGRLIAVSEVTDGAFLRSNVVTDGLNYFVAISNLDRQRPARATLSVNRDLSQVANSHVVGYRFEEVANSKDLPLGRGEGQLRVELLPKETKLVYVGAQVEGVSLSEMRALSTSIRSALGTSPWSGFDTEPAEKCLDSIDGAMAFGAAYVGRAVAGLVVLRNLILLRSGPRMGAQQENIPVHAARIHFTLPQQTIATGNADVQVLRVLNGSEEGDLDPSMQPYRTNASGQVVVTLGALSHEHWDFRGVHGRYQVATGIPVPEPVEIHINDPVYRVHAKTTVV